MTFNKPSYLSLNNEKIDTLTKHFDLLHVLIIDEVSIIGSTLLYQIDNILGQIKHTPTSYFANVDLILSCDLYQAQPIKYCLIFEDPTLDKQKMSYPFWKDEVTCYELHTTMHQKIYNSLRFKAK